MFENKTCDYCGEPFAKNDDIVVCPDCGAPYHRACWDKHGECAHKAEHAAGYAYESAMPEKDFVGEIKAEMAQQNQAQPQDSSQTAAQEGYCDNCGAKLVEGNEYCVYCAHRKGDPVMRRNPKYAQVDPLAGMAPGEEIAGETVGDMALVIRNNSAKILPQFKKLAGKKVKISWSWPAFFFGYLYLFFRKLYKYGIIFIMAQVLLLNVFNFALGDPVAKVNQIMREQYSTVEKADTLSQEESYEAYYKVLESVALEMNAGGITKQIYLMVLGNILVSHVACALLFRWLYMKHCRDTIERMKKSAEILGGMSKSEFRLNLMARGGVSIFGIIIGYFAKMTIEQIVAMIISSIGG